MKLASVDVIIPLYNKAPYIAQAIRSALEQTVPVKAVYVADDASTDDSVEVVRQLAREDSRVCLITAPYLKPSGEGATRNRAIERCQSDFVAFLDADDWWDDLKLQLQLPLFQNDDVGLVHCGSRSVDGRGHIISEQLPPPKIVDREILFEEVALGRYAVTGSASGVVMRRSLLSDIGGFSEDLNFGADWDMWSRAAGKSMFDYVSHPLTNIRVLTTFSRTLGAEREFLLWLKVFDRWQDNKVFMQKACEHARSRAISAQLEIFWDRRFAYLIFSYPKEIFRKGGKLGQSIYSSQLDYWFNLYRIGPHILKGFVKAVLRRLTICLR